MGLWETGLPRRDGRTPRATYLSYQPVSMANSQGWPAGMAAKIRRTCSGVQQRGSSRLGLRPHSTLVDFIGEVCHPAGDPARVPRLRVRQDPGQGTKNGGLYLRVCHVTPIPPEPPKEHRYANNSNLSIDVEHTR